MKKWIRNIGAGFLVMMLVFTFLSRAAASVTTAVVSTQKAVSGEISHSISVSGEVEAVQDSSVTVAISAEYEEYLAIGDSVTLKKNGETDTIQGAKLADIQYNEDNTDGIVLTVAITTTALEYGDQVEVTFDDQSEQYGMLVPVSAIYMQNDETYVLIVQEAEEILGTVLRAQKVNVEILDKNSSYAAISAAGVYGQDIIVQSDREVKDGSRIRRQAA